MNWKRIQCLFSRELRDQLRDRRTMFTIFCLPLMLYPLMGLLMMQMAQLRTPRQLQVAIIDSVNLPDGFVSYLEQRSTPKVEQGTKTKTTPADNHAATTAEGKEPYVFSDQRGNKIAWVWHEQEKVAEKAKTIMDNFAGSEPALPPEAHPNQESRNDILGDSFDNPVLASELLRAMHVDAIILPNRMSAKADLKVIADLASEDSQMAHSNVTQMIATWRDKKLADVLIETGVEREFFETLPVTTVDVADVTKKQTILWAKVLPLIMFVWALTGAFYPAIDLCAGEKERGTLETLLSGPASRREIVCGKLFAVICFSVLTAVLNLMSMQITISIVSKQFAGMGLAAGVSMGPLPWHAIGWLLVMLLPISILFSAVALAIAALARSSKEGQYYLMPLLVIGMPLVMLPMMPGIRLSVGTSLFPVAGAILLARTLVEGQYAQAVMFAPMVVLVTGTCCWLATRWAIRQFESESVLFRETDRFDMTAWLQHLWRDRSDVASPNMSALCAAIVLISLFYARLQASTNELTWSYVARSTIATQLAMILAPCLIMAIFLTTSIRKALRLHKVGFISLPASILLAVCMHPAYIHLSQWVQKEFPFSEDTRSALAGVDGLLAAAPLWGLLLTFALIPAICEELAFRGFIFAGLQHNRGTVRAVVVTSALFGLSHGVLQQSISATLMGFILGMIAWRTGSVVCCIVIHAVHNSLSMLFVRAATAWEQTPSVLQPFVEQTADGFQYTGNWQAISSVVAISLLYYFLREPKSEAVPQSLSTNSSSTFAPESVTA